jgi:oligopeptide/dipeptide ABC transporter ATP-binding protein
LLEVSDLHVELPIEGTLRAVVAGVSLHVAQGEALAIVGESGSGKSMTARAISRMLPIGAVCTGSVTFAGEDVLAMSQSELRNYYIRAIGFVFQDPRAHINPVHTIGDFMTEVLVTTLKETRRAARRRAVELLTDVGIARAEGRLQQYPHELSGGLLQRVMIASALAPGPKLLIADEPTTALDVTTQAEVIAILNEQRSERGMAMIFITHDLDLVAAVCDRTAVMYAGSIVEEQASATLYDSPLHPYTVALARARPDLTKHEQHLYSIPGSPLSAFDAPHGCPFAPRCPHALAVCRAERPALERHATGVSACIRAGELPSLAPTILEQQ